MTDKKIIDLDATIAFDSVGNIYLNLWDGDIRLNSENIADRDIAEQLIIKIKTALKFI